MTRAAAAPDASADTERSGLTTRLAAVPAHRLYDGVTPVEELTRLRAALGGGPRLLVKRDDAIPFGFGGNKVRKVERELAAALEAGADVVVTVGGVQSNHCRVTAAAAAKAGIGCVIVANGTRPETPTGNALLVALLGAEVRYIASRAERERALADTLAGLRAAGRRPYAIPLGASTGIGATGYVAAVGELLGQIDAPTAIVHASSSGGTQAGIVLGCALHGVATRVLGISADDPATDIERGVRAIIADAADRLGLAGDALARDCSFEVDADFVGDGYGVPTDASREAARLAARTEALFVDHTYTAKALAGLIAYVRAGRFTERDTVLFWHTGGQPALFA